MKRSIIALLFLVTGLASLIFTQVSTVSSEFQSSSAAIDPGVRGGEAGAGYSYPELTKSENSFFEAGKTDFEEQESAEEGLGPLMNLDSCVGCHMQPATGGSAPPINPQVAFATKEGANNKLPSFITVDGPVREARFVKNPDGSPDGGVHALFTIAGRSDAGGCNAKQPDFAAAEANKNVIFRIPTPVFGAGLIEQISDSEIVANATANASQKQGLGIRGRPNIVLAGSTVSGQPNRNGNDGTIARFGWKAQNKSLLLFSGEAYNVEMGITNELFQTERDESAQCQTAPTPNSVTNTDAVTMPDTISSIEKFTMFMRFLNPPSPSADTPGGGPSIKRGANFFNSVGCTFCHTPTLHTGNSNVAALRNKAVNLYSDLLLHDMGSGLADGVSQGQAGPSEFRTAPLWGLGQRVFFLHDGRTKDLGTAIQAHQSRGGGRNDADSEANAVVQRYNNLSPNQQQDILNFLRSL